MSTLALFGKGDGDDKHAKRPRKSASPAAVASAPAAASGVQRAPAALWQTVGGSVDEVFVVDDEGFLGSDRAAVERAAAWYAQNLMLLSLNTGVNVDPPTVPESASAADLRRLMLTMYAVARTFQLRIGSLGFKP